jgi:hypothetical protein
MPNKNFIKSLDTKGFNMQKLKLNQAIKEE